MHALIAHRAPIFEPIEATLRGVGYSSFDRASTIAAARLAARRRRPDLIVTGYRFPDGTAREAVNAICPVREVPLVFVTIETDAVLNWLPSAVIVTDASQQIALEIAVEEAILRPFSRSRTRPRPIGGPEALIYC
jgi:hypothetical protein